MYIVTFKINKLILMVSILILTILITVFSFASDKNEEKVNVPIIMYHHVLKDSNYHGKYVISPNTFENDLSYLIKQGYETVTVEDLIDFIYKGNKLPKKPIVLTFDDGHLSNYSYIFPIIEKYKQKIVISVVGDYTDDATKNNDRNIAYSYLSWDDIKSLSSSGLVEIANHTYSFHNQNKRIGIGNIKGESKEEYEKNISKDLIKLNDKLLSTIGKLPSTFTYPFGKAVNMSFDIIKKIGFKASLSCEEGINEIVYNDFDCLYLLKRFNRPSGISTSDFFKDIL